MSGETTAVPEPMASITINIGPLNITYQGPRDYLKDLPSLIVELQKIAPSILNQQQAPQ